MLNVNKDFRKIRDTYTAIALKNKPPNIPGCHWAPTPFEILEKEVQKFKTLTEKGIISDDKKILVLGLGDGRELAYFSHAGYDIYGVELNPELIKQSNTRLDTLAKQGVVDKDRIHIIKGSFLEDKTYEDNGVRFSDFKNLTCYLLPRNMVGVVKKIYEESRKGTSLLSLTLPNWYFSSHWENVEDSGLEKTHDKKLGKVDMETFYLTIFQKTK